MSSEDVKAEEIILVLRKRWSWNSCLLSAWKGRGEKLFLESNDQTGCSLFVGCTNRGRRIFWAFYCFFFSVSSIIWVLQDCWGAVRKCQLMLCVLTIENQRTMFGQSLFASKLFFFFAVLVSAKDEYEQCFLLSKKKMSNVRKKFLQCLC